MRRPRRGHRRLKPTSALAAGAGVSVPFVAIVGRPNVGKSTLFNRLMGRRIAIVEKTAGTTRDRLSAVLELPSSRRVELCDMGGLGGTDDPLDKDVDRQIGAAIELADIVLFLVDARAGATPLDQEIARRLKKLGKPVVLVANKAETKELEDLSGELYVLGLGDPLPISAREGTGKSELLERLDAVFPEEDGGEGDARPLEAGKKHELRVAIVGRRNSGKSSFVNALFGSERVIVSPLPGTTRDAVDVRCLVDGEPVVLIDTAGLRKRGRADDQIELISHGRAREAIRRADVAIVILDALRDVSEVDKKICELVLDENKAAVIAANKWDLVQDRMSVEQFADYVRKKLSALSFAPIAAISCSTGWNVRAPVALARDLNRQSHIRVTTGELNRAVRDAFVRRRPRKHRHVIAKLYFATQIRTNPVTIVLFVNKPDLFDADYRRYLASELRAMLPWSEVPLKLVFRERRGLLERGLTRAAREKRQLEKTRRWLSDEGAVPAEEVAAELDREDVREALAAELAEEESRERTPSPAGKEGRDDVSYEEEPEPKDDLLYGEDADVIRRRRGKRKARDGGS